MNQLGQLPDWIDFEMEDPQLDISPLMGALKQRQLKQPEGGLGGGVAEAMGGEMPKTNPLQKGVKSL